MVITLHFVDASWQLKKLIIGFKYITDHKGQTVASESAFSTSGRIIDSYRSCLTHYMVEVLMCSEQWLKADIRCGDARLVTMEQILSDFEYEDKLKRGSFSSMILYVFFLSVY